MIDNEQRKIVFSAIKPTGNLTLGNYIGALKNWVEMEKDYDCFYAVADLHAITVSIVPQQLRANSAHIFAMLLALGLNPDKSALFIQSHVPYHSELTWVLNCFTQFGEARRMTQFKDKSLKNPQNVNVGLFDYPVLMAADILLYQADYVPVGKDQNQHVELTRVIAERFNNKYSPTFKVPEGLNPKVGAKIYSLSEPTGKMGKTDAGTDGVIMLLDKPADVMKKLKRAVTDSGSDICYAPSEKAGISNLLTIYSVMADCTIKQAEAKFKGYSYADFKEETANAIINVLTPLQEKYNHYISDKAQLESLMKSGAEKASYAARKTLSKVYRKVGFLV